MICTDGLTDYLVSPLRRSRKRQSLWTSKDVSGRAGVAVARIPFTNVVKGRYWRFRRGALNVPLPGCPGDRAFHEKYSELLALSDRQAAEKHRDSFASLIKLYRKSPEFTSLADTTQMDYDRTLTLIETEMGDQPFALTTRGMIKMVQADYASTARKAHKIKQMISTLYSYADECGLVDPGFNPTKGIKKPKTKDGVKQYVAWSDYEIEAYLACAPLHAQTPVLIALYTGQRREDVLSMTWKQLQGDEVRVRQSKTKTLLTIPLHRKLQQHLTGLKRKGIQICTNAEGLPYSTANAMSGVIRRVVESCPEMPNNRSMHGLKYAAGSTLEEAGCTLAEIQSILGNRTYAMAMQYSTQRVRARSAIEKTENFLGDTENFSV